MKRRTPEERLATSYEVDEKGCWRWTGRHTTLGYGQLHVGGRDYLAHRLMYERDRGPIPSGLELDHLCRVRDCVNPAHLEAVSHAENIRRSPLTPRSRPLSELQVQAVRVLRAGGMTYSEIGVVLDIDTSTAFRIAKGQRRAA